MAVEVVKTHENLCFCPSLGSLRSQIFHQSCFSVLQFHTQSFYYKGKGRPLSFSSHLGECFEFWLYSSWATFVLFSLLAEIMTRLGAS